ncbi:AF4/FMR2 family member lilli [Toxorhynchites rutilus septentrionalis]|uniref:AF4/FMR2 family member lilli n=1 Tax=Toxorhynchites rutilus septentrionalis TaxID=329112 RepID=UPI002478960B|nr:AF4/FMR2 family member lilli [Toxorhynchites rutilus septentrionalis]XP_055621468.1 AF4/FMR2 family member lilli [Toxorhynchites rutilus septentrionalis]XP_055621475.1 AF4/FMR2 family member lilli [Toxorhynchites rutilus septentrionalis]XP_055621481.1 AF4/FMR2 family member lilli [Toxorhynchites rutilus septentrionalis]XP_055621489.1 AF4/FMR2 family member lilli [Toxorhynchites rutilus septentrionalis]XP_055621498.1 AF4/FMR2 family member lilli [Toxorhynchites rutilus septentrionalis]XP_05
MPVGNVPYHHRRKYSPQLPPDYQSRIFFGDYTRESRTRVSGGVVNGSAGSSTSSSSQVAPSSGAVGTTVCSASGSGVSLCSGEELYSISGSSASTTSSVVPDTCNSGTTAASSISGNVSSASSNCSGNCQSPTTAAAGNNGAAVSSVNNFAASNNNAHNGNGPTSPVSREQIKAAVAVPTAAAQQPSAQNYPPSVALYAVQRVVPSAGTGGGSGASLVSVSSSANSCNIVSGSGNNNNTVIGGLVAGVPNSILSGASLVSWSNNGNVGSTGNNNNDDCDHQNSPGPGSSTNSYTIGGSSSIDLQQQQILQKQQQQQQQQQQQLQQSSSLSSSISLINNNNQIRDRDSTNYVNAAAISTLNASVNNISGISCSNTSNSNNNNNNNNLNNSSNHHVNLGGATPASATMTTTSAAISPPRPMQKVIPTVVYLMSRIAVHMEIEGTAQCPAQVMLAAALGCEELGITNKLLAQSVFGLWMTSPLLEVQLKPHHRPYAVRVAWSKLLDKHSHGNELEKLSNEPMTTLRRNVFFSKRDEEKIKDPRILELLYEEARHNVLLGRYAMESSHSIMLGGIQARIELGPYNSHTHSTSYFRENQFRFLPAHVAKSSSWSWLPISRRTSAEVRLLEQFKRVPTTATTKKLMRKYLEFCWALPFYGAAYFHGQVEQPVRGLMSLMQQKDLPVLIAVNERGIFVIDQIECTLLLGLKYEELSWDYAKPSNVNDPECLPCIFLQFGAVENGIAATKLMQIFTRQAAMIDALITHFIEQAKRRKESGESDATAAAAAGENPYEAEPNPIQNNGVGVLSNKLSRLTLATFDDEGRCIGQMGSLSISY